MKSAYGYARVSTARQRDEGYSLEYQKDKTFRRFDERFSDTHSWGGVYPDGGVSGSKKQVLQRPGGILLHQKLKEGDVLIVTRIARICRSLPDFLFMLRYWDERGISFVCCDDPVDTSDKSPFGRFVVHLIGAFAELEAGMLSERIKESYASRIKKGVRLNDKHPPMYEWGKDGKLYPFQPELTSAEMFFKMRTQDKLDVKQIYFWCLKHRYRRVQKTGKKFNTEWHMQNITALSELHRRYLWLSSRGVDVFGREYLDATARRETPMMKGGVMPREMFADPLISHCKYLFCREADS